ncbi:MAG: HigA family addiction module antitoxin [Gemmatimonadaceae bacterium]
MRQEDRASHPGAVLRSTFLRPSGVSGAQLARHLGVSPRRIGALLRGERPLTLEIAQRLEAAGAMNESYWLRLQHVWERRTARMNRRKHRITVLPAFREVSRDIVSSRFPSGFNNDDDSEY